MHPDIHCLAESDPDKDPGNVLATTSSGTHTQELEQRDRKIRLNVRIATRVADADRKGLDFK